MSSLENPAIKSEIETRLREMEQVVHDLENQIAGLNDQLTGERHRLDISREFYRLEFKVAANSALAGMELPMFDVPLRFAKTTVRAACQQLLKERGPLHVSVIQEAVEEGGRKVSKTSISSVLNRAEEFERVEGQPNTFRLATDVTPKH